MGGSRPLPNYIRTKQAAPRHLLAPLAMITGPDQSHHHMITSAMSRRSCRAAGSLRRPSETRALPASRSTIYLDDACSPSRDRWLLRTIPPRCGGLRRNRRHVPSSTRSEHSGTVPRSGVGGFLHHHREVQRSTTYLDYRRPRWSTRRSLHLHLSAMQRSTEKPDA